MDSKTYLGFTQQQFNPGVHVCQIYSNDHDRHDALVKYILSGLISGENTVCFSEMEDMATLAEIFKQHGISIEDAVKSGEFVCSKTAKIYFENGKFDPDKLIDRLIEFYETSKKQKRLGARIIGEMSPNVEQIEGGSRLLEYEAKVSKLINIYPINAVCQYDAHSFDGSVILEILKMHPYMLIRGTVVRNPFFIQPEEYLSQISPHGHV